MNYYSVQHDGGWFVFENEEGEPTDTDIAVAGPFDRLADADHEARLLKEED